MFLLLFYKWYTNNNFSLCKKCVNSFYFSWHYKRMQRYVVASGQNVGYQYLQSWTIWLSSCVLQAELIVGDQSGVIHIWDLKTDHNEQLIPEPDVAINSVHIDPDASYMAAVNSSVSGLGQKVTLHLLLYTNAQHARRLAVYVLRHGTTDRIWCRISGSFVSFHTLCWLSLGSETLSGFGRPLSNI